jgi:hypothetical protein
MPEGHRRMRALLNRDPEAFRSRISAHLPRLRRLMTIFDADPDLGRAFVRHMDNMLAVRRARDQLRQGKGLNPPAAMVEQIIRQRMADNLEIEQAALDRLLRSGSKSRDADVKRLQNWLASPGVDVSAEPPALRNAVEAFRAADGPEREQLRAKLDELAAKRIDSDLDALKTRLERLQKNADREIDRRVARAMDLSDRASNEVMAAPSSRPKP